MKPSNRTRRQILRFGSLTFVGAAIFGGEKAAEYSAPPISGKACDFVFPKTSDDEKLITFDTTPPSVPIDSIGGFVNDASCLNKTAIFGIVKIRNIEDIKNALHFAREHHLKVSAAGQRHSMGGQTFSKNGLVLDMRGFNQISIDKEKAIAHVQTGATWEQLQMFADAQGLSVQAMQSINVFTVGGSISVNGHGIAHRPGPLATTIVALRIMLASGEIKQASPTENPELFRLAVGGYGLFGVIVDADLQLVRNEVYALENYGIDYREFPGFYRENISNNDQIGLFYGRISVSPVSYLRETAAHVYRRTEFQGAIPALKPSTHDRLERFVINFSKTGDVGRWLRWTLEKHYGPRLHNCLSRNQAITPTEPCLVSRNEEMYDPMAYLKNRLEDTDILQEYFILPDKMAEFVDGLRNTVQANNANLLNVTIRIVHQDKVSAMPYAKEDMFAFVLYFNQKLNEEESLRLQKTTRDLISLALSLNGTYYLPYQLYYSREQLEQAYPEVSAFFAAKKKFDPDGMFTNKFYEKYGPS